MRTLTVRPGDDCALSDDQVARVVAIAEGVAANHGLSPSHAQKRHAEALGTGSIAAIGPRRLFDVALDSGGGAYLSGVSPIHYAEFATGQMTPIDAGIEVLDGRHIGIEASGHVLVADRDDDAIHRVDPATGLVTSVSIGGLLDSPSGLLVVPLPEPGALASLAAGALLLTRLQRRRRARG